MRQQVTNTAHIPKPPSPTDQLIRLGLRGRF